MGVDGILNILKPPGITSFAVVSRIRRLSGERRVGHAGTLDPAATGVLVVCLGQGTRVIEFLAGARKTYRAVIKLGAATDTYDASGRIIHSGDPSSVRREQVEEVLNSFRGCIEQTPPMYSARKHQGTRLYRLARKGIEVPRAPSRVDIFRLDLVEWQPPALTIEVECSAGTYVRTLAHDVGIALGCGAHLADLVRIESQPFHISQAVPLSTVEEAFPQGDWPRLLYPIDEVLTDWEAVVLSEESEARVKNGSSICLGEGDATTQGPCRCRAYAPDGRFLAILRHEGKNVWHPEKVFR
ncbi:MAG: tRNA pseudouridine(55) synthase TruB [Chloroflexi bacterium]|nr:MAG: tRNA pseudouridine(55) synthase TruB [Chloroflexota bacterium]